MTGARKAAHSTAKHTKELLLMPVRSRRRSAQMSALKRAVMCANHTHRRSSFLISQRKSVLTHILLYAGWRDMHVVAAAVATDTAEAPSCCMRVLC